jgi:hypothetical protein
VQPAYQPAPRRGSRKTLWIVLTVIAVVLVAGVPAGGETFAFVEAAQLTVDGEDAADTTVGAPVEFTSTNQPDKPEKGRFVYVPVTMKVTGTEKVSINPFDVPVGTPITVAYSPDLDVLGTWQ